MGKKNESLMMATAVALGPLMLLVGVILLGAWVADQERARARAKVFLEVASHMHVEDRELFWEKFKVEDPAAAKFIRRATNGLGIRMII